MKLVQFDDGSYGVRSHWFFGWKFLAVDTWLLETLPYHGLETYPMSDSLFRFCTGTKEEALATIERRKPPKVVKMGYKIVNE